MQKMWGRITGKCKILWKMRSTCTGRAKVVTGDTGTEVRTSEASAKISASKANTETGTGEKCAKVRTSQDDTKAKTDAAGDVSTGWICREKHDKGSDRYAKAVTGIIKANGSKAGKETGINQFYAEAIGS